MTDSRENQQAESRRKRQEKKKQEAELMGEMLFGSIAGVPKAETQYVNLGERLASAENRAWEAEENAQVVYAKSPKPEVRRDERETLEDFPELADMKNLENSHKSVSQEVLSEREGFIAMEKENMENRTESIPSLQPAPVEAVSGNTAENYSPQPENPSGAPVLTGEKEENIRFSSATLTSSILSAVAEVSERNLFHKYALQITTIGASVLVIFIMVFVVKMREGDDSSTADTTAGTTAEQVVEHSAPAPVPVPENAYGNIHAPIGNFPTATENVKVYTAEPTSDPNSLQFSPEMAYAEQFAGVGARSSANEIPAGQVPGNNMGNMGGVYHDHGHAAAPYGTENPVYNPELAGVASQESPIQLPVLYDNRAPRMDYSTTDEHELPYFNPELAGPVATPPAPAPYVPAMNETIYPNFETYEKMVAGKVDVPTAPAPEVKPYAPRKLSPPPSALRKSQAMDNQTAETIPPTYVPLDYPNPTPMNVAPVAPSFGAGAPQAGVSDYPTFDPSRSVNTGGQAGGEIPASENYIGRW